MTISPQKSRAKIQLTVLKGREGAVPDHIACRGAHKSDGRNERAKATIVSSTGIDRTKAGPHRQAHSQARSPNLKQTLQMHSDKAAIEASFARSAEYTRNPSVLHGGPAFRLARLATRNLIPLLYVCRVILVTKSAAVLWWCCFLWSAALVCCCNAYCVVLCYVVRCGVVSCGGVCVYVCVCMCVCV